MKNEMYGPSVGVSTSNDVNFDVSTFFYVFDVFLLFCLKSNAQVFSGVPVSNDVNFDTFFDVFA